MVAMFVLYIMIERNIRAGTSASFGWLLWVLPLLIGVLALSDLPRIWNVLAEGRRRGPPIWWSNWRTVALVVVAVVASWYPVMYLNLEYELGLPTWVHLFWWVLALPTGYIVYWRMQRVLCVAVEVDGTACTYCAQSMVGLEDRSACPECGRPFDADDARRRWGRVVPMSRIDPVHAREQAGRD